MGLTSHHDTHVSLDLPSIYVKSRLLPYRELIDSSPLKKPRSDTNKIILMAQTDTAYTEDLKKLEALRQQGLLPRVIVSVEETADLNNVSSHLVDLLEAYGAQLDGTMPALKMFVLKFPTSDTSQRYKALDVEALQIINNASGVEFAEVDSRVEAM